MKAAFAGFTEFIVKNFIDAITKLIAVYNIFIDEFPNAAKKLGLGKIGYELTDLGKVIKAYLRLKN